MLCCTSSFGSNKPIMNIKGRRHMYLHCTVHLLQAWGGSHTGSLQSAYWNQVLLFNTFNNVQFVSLYSSYSEHMTLPNFYIQNILF